MCLTGQGVDQDSVSDREQMEGVVGQGDGTEPRGMCIGSLLLLFSDM